MCDLSVVVCTYNGGERLGKVLKSLASQSLRERWQLVVVDNASTDDTSDVVRRVTADYPVPVLRLHEPTPGKAFALRKAFATIQSKFFCVVDDDNFLGRDYLLHGLRFLQSHDDVGMIGGRTLPRFPDDVNVPSDFEERYSSLLACHDRGPDLQWDVVPPGAGQMGRADIVRDVYEGIGTYLEDRVGMGVGCGEDLEKAIVVRRLGWRTAHVPDLCLEHEMSARRLDEDYIDSLVCAATQVTPWLHVLGGEVPRDPVYHLWMTARYKSMSAIYSIAKWCKLVVPLNSAERADHWAKFYAAWSTGHIKLVKDALKINAMLNRIDRAPSSMRPPSR